MCGGFAVRKPIATWDATDSAWVTSRVAPCGHSVLFSDSFPPSGTMRNGVIYAPPMSGHPTRENASSSSHGLLPTPQVADVTGGHKRQSGSRSRELLLPGVAESLMPTPRATDGTNGGPNMRGSSGDLMLPSVACRLLPTPQAHDAVGGKTPEQVIAMRVRGRAKGKAPGVFNLNEVIPQLLPTPAARDHKSGKSGIMDRNARPLNEVAEMLLLVDWGQYEAAVIRWAATMGAPPPPTELSVRGSTVLSPAFTEWMMGLPAGWVTSLPLSRNAQLKILGNGVVPQQAIAALHEMMDLI